MATAVGGNHRRTAVRTGEQAGDGFGIQRGRHHQQSEVLAQALLHLQAQRQGQVALQIALMKFVEDDQTDAIQLRVTLNAAGQYALGQDLDPGTRRDLALQAHPETHAVADPITAQAGHAGRGGAGGQPARLQHQDLAPRQPRLIEQGQRYDGGLARARWSAEHRRRAGAQGLLQRRQHGVNGQVGGHAQWGAIAAGLITAVVGSGQGITRCGDREPGLEPVWSRIWSRIWRRCSCWGMASGL